MTVTTAKAMPAMSQVWSCLGKTPFGATRRS
jgi:hypothetical protein